MHDMTRYNWLCQEIERVDNLLTALALREMEDDSGDFDYNVNEQEFRATHYISMLRAEKRKIEQELADHGND